MARTSMGGEAGEPTPSLRLSRIGRSAARILLSITLLLGGALLVLKIVFTQPTFGSIPGQPPFRADPGRLREVVETLCDRFQPRNADHPEVLDGAAEYLSQALLASGGRVRDQEYRARGATYRNVISSFGPETGSVFVVGAHYDVYGDLPGADDNASGVAALVELARMLGVSPPPLRVDLVAYANEEPPFFASDEMGSAIHAGSLAAEGTPVQGMLSLEMLGFYTERQPWNNRLLEALYPRHGGFLMVVGRWEDRALTRYSKRAFRGASPLPVVTFVGPRIPGPDASDHRCYWDRGYHAAMITDSAYVRNHHYHTPGDTPETLDYGKMALAVEGVFGILTNLQEAPPPP